jgi:hypothetical protein
VRVDVRDGVLVLVMLVAVRMVVMVVVVVVMIVIVRFVLVALDSHAVAGAAAGRAHVS